MDLVIYPNDMPMSIAARHMYGDKYRVTLKCLSDQCPRHCDCSLTMHGERLFVSAAELAGALFSRCKELDALEEEMHARAGLINLTSLADKEEA